jgi:hypothetical protein
MKTLVLVVSVGALLVTTGGTAARARQRASQAAASAGQAAESAARMLDSLIASRGWEAGAAEYRKKVAGHTQYSVVEREFIALGSRYLQSGRMREAIAVFEIATEALARAAKATCMCASANLTGRGARRSTSGTRSTRRARTSARRCRPTASTSSTRRIATSTG